MKELRFFTAALVAVAVAVSPASALEWTTMGAQAMGMGGAGVANIQGPEAVYWNPAALGRPSMNAYGLSIPVSVQANVQGSVIAGAKDLQQCTNGSCNSTQVSNALNELRGGGLNADVGGGGSLKIGKFTAFLNGYVEAAAGPGNIDTTNVGACPGPTCISNNKSTLIVRGARILELGLGYGHELPWVPGLYLGGDVKAMNAQVGYGQFNIVSNNGVNSNFVSTLQQNSVTSGNVGVDLGALWDIDKTFNGVAWSPRVGVTGRNLNDPKFSNPSIIGGDFAINPTVRSGLSFAPFHWWRFAADADLTRNLTPLDGYADQDVGAGTEIDVFNRSWINIPIRAGIKHNMAQPTNGATFTAGSGVNLLHLIIDVSGEVGNQSIVIQNQGNTTRIPREVGGSVQLSFLFGGSEENHRLRDAGEDQPVTSDKARADMSPSDAARVRADADKAQQELNNQPSGN